MPLKRPAFCFLLGLLLSASGTGCAVMEALVTTPGSGQNASPPAERLTAIARVFENQGDLTQAESMYRMAIRQDPGNQFARERVEYIASLGNTRSFGAQPVQDAIAVADSIEVRRAQPQQRPNAAALAASAKERLTSDGGPLQTQAPAGFATVSVAAPSPVTHHVQPRPVAETPIAVSPSVTRVSASLPYGESAMVTQPVATMETNTLRDSAPAARVTLSGQPVSVTLDEVAEWMDSPADYTSELVRAVEAGEDAGVQALAAALLADCPTNDRQVDQALQAACSSSDSLVRATARDSLIRRGSLDLAGVQDLMSLLSDNDAEIRSQAAASLRNCVGTKWSSHCVSGLGELLQDLNPSVRAMAAATLGDFIEAADTAQEARRLLQDIRQSEDDENVLNAIDTSLDRSEIAGSVSGGESGGQPLPPVTN